MATILVEDTENLEKAIKRFKRMVEKEGIIREYKKREYSRMIPSFSTILLKRLIAFSRFSVSSTKIVAMCVHLLTPEESVSSANLSKKLKKIKRLELLFLKFFRAYANLFLVFLGSCPLQNL